MKYKRLTKSYKGAPLHTDMEVTDGDEIYERLAEIEDKIEQGTLIELGYHIRKSYRNQDDQRYKIVIVEENDIDKIGYDCLTREEAEKRLKELQNG